MTDPSKLRSCVAVTLLLAVAVAGCGAGHGEQAPLRALSAADAGTATSLAADELLTITLDSRLSAGFAWQVDELDPAVLRLASREAVPAEAMGGKDQEVLRFAGVGPGTTSLGLFYRRAWDPAGTGPVYRIEVEVAGAYAGPAIRAAAPAAAARVAVPAQVASGTIPESYDACATESDPYARCTPVKDQGGCGACWAFATAAVVENALYFADPSRVPDLSVQYLVSCNVERSPRWGCDGGYVAFDYFIGRKMSPPETDAGAVYEADFPYLGVDAACGSSPHPHHEWLSDWGWTNSAFTTDQAVALIQQAILDHGPVWTDVCADTRFQEWRPSDGVFTDTGCTKKNHGVVLVGWGLDPTRGGYWIMRNSWGPTWGDRGYMRIAWGANGIGARAAYAVYDPRAPHANAGLSQTVESGAAVTLDGSASRDADGSIRSWAWAQPTGPLVALSDAGAARPTFIAPVVAETTELHFQLTVEDDLGIRATDQAAVTVVPPAAGHDTLAKGGGGGGGCGTAGGPAGWALLGLLLALTQWTRPRARPGPARTGSGAA